MGNAKNFVWKRKREEKGSFLCHFCVCEQQRQHRAVDLCSEPSFLAVPLLFHLLSQYGWPCEREKRGKRWEYFGKAATAAAAAVNQTPAAAAVATTIVAPDLRTHIT